MATFVLIPGGWHGGWMYAALCGRLRDAGHEAYALTLSGLEETPSPGRTINLETHIADVAEFLTVEDISGVILCAHSYGGMVATGVADRASYRIARLVYLDAFAPRDGQSLLDLQTEENRQRVSDGARDEGDGWQIPPSQVPADTSEVDLAWVMAHRMPQPIKTFEQKIKLTGAVERLPRTYIYCKISRPGDVFRQFRDRASTEQGWQCIDIDASHSPNVTAPEALAKILDGIASARG